MTEKKFDLGYIVVSDDVYNKTKLNKVFNRFMADALERYSQGDWGDIDANEAAANNEALKNGGALFAKYRDYDDKNGIYVTTTPDRSTTSISNLD